MTMQKVEISRMALNIGRSDLTPEAQPPDLLDLFIDLQNQLGAMTLRGIVSPTDDIYQYLEQQELYDADADADTDADADADADIIPGEFGRTVYLLAGENGTYDQCIDENGDPLEVHYEIAFLRKRYLRDWDKVVLFRYGNGVTAVYTENHPSLQQIELLKYRREGERFFVTALQKPRGIVWGFNVSYAGSGFDFLVAPGGYFIGGQYFEASLPDGFPSVTLSAPPVSESRIDVIAAKRTELSEDDNDGFDTPIAGEIVVIEGTAGDYPVKPVIDPDEYVEITHILLPAGALSFQAYVTEQVIYDENTEWVNNTLRSGATTFNPDSVAMPYRGSKSFEVSGLTGNTVTISFQQDAAATPFDMAGYGAIPFFLKLKAATTGRVYVSAQWMIYGAEPISDAVYVEAGVTTDWQALQIPVRDLAIYGTGDPAAAWLYFRITIEDGTGHAGFYLDYIKWAGGIAQPVINDEVRLIGDVVGEGKVGEEIETELAVITDGGTKGGAGKSLEITYDSKGRILSVEEFFITGADEIRFRVEGGVLQYTYDIDADIDADVDGYGWTDMVVIPPDTQLDFVGGQILYRYVPVGVDETTVMWDVLVDLEVFVNSLLTDSDADFDTHITGFAAAVEAGTPPTVGNDDTISLTITDSKGATYKVTLGGHAALIPWHGTQAQYDAIVTKKSNTIYYINEA